MLFSHLYEARDVGALSGELRSVLSRGHASSSRDGRHLSLCRDLFRQVVDKGIQGSGGDIQPRGLLRNFLTWGDVRLTGISRSFFRRICGSGCRRGMRCGW